ncbi:MAG: hypothetical protein M0P97_00855 [Candidatus Moranbacteria bacterium]|jgi:hypothetical protein|nr:hypothetical protein [Candidatus Moranbacteria bacterium]
MLKKIISKFSHNKKSPKKEVNFFDLSQVEKEQLIKKAARLSSQDQKDLLKEYDRKFGDLQTNSCK